MLIRGLTCVLVVVFLALPHAQGKQSFTGTITDSECADAYHGRMRMGDSDAECAKACVEVHGATWLLYNGMSSYQLSDQKAPVAFAGQKVTVVGTLDAKSNTITVESIAAAK